MANTAQRRKAANRTEDRAAAGSTCRAAKRGGRVSGGITAVEDIASVAGQLADLTHTVEGLAAEVKALRENAEAQQQRADDQHARSEIQQERIDLAARELAEVSARLQAAADALREAI